MSATDNKEPSSWTLPPKVDSVPYMFERETEALGFTPLTFIDTMINAVNEYTHSVLDSVQDLVDSELSDMEKEQEKELGMQRAATLLESVVDVNCDRWELLCLNKVFYRDFQETEGKEALKSPGGLPLEQKSKELLDMHTELIQTLSLNKQLGQEIKVVDARIAHLKALQNRREVLRRITASQTRGATVKDDVKFVCSEAHDIKSMDDQVESLSQRINSLTRLQVKKSNSQQESSNSTSSVDNQVDIDLLHVDLIQGNTLKHMQTILDRIGA